MPKIRTRTKGQVIERLKRNIQDIKALIKDIDAWDIYNDENWENLIESMEEAIKYINSESKSCQRNKGGKRAELGLK